MTRTIVVTGATGRVGGQVLAQLAGTGVRVRALGRDAGSLRAAADPHGAETVVADLTDPASLDPVLDGVDALFLVFPSVAGDAAAPETVAALTARVPRVVYLSAADPPGVPAAGGEGTIMGSHALLERLLGEWAAESTFLRASGFASNTLAWAEQTRTGSGEVRWFGPGITRSLVHEADLAAVGVRVLLEDGHAGASYHLTGPEQITQVQQVEALGAALGRPLRFVDLGPDAGPTLFPQMPAAAADDIVRGQLGMAETAEPLTHEVQRLTGAPARTYRQWARDHVQDFR